LHRVKNTLALVKSISNQTFRDAASLDDARQTLTQRLLVLPLARCHDTSASSPSQLDIACGATRGGGSSS
jgi:two-component sensor histidine kinase